MGLVAVIWSPDLLQQHAIREHLVRIGQEHFEQVVLGRREVHDAARNQDLAAFEIYNEFAAAHTTLGTGRRTRDVPERDADAREPLVDPARLGHVVVWAAIEGVGLAGLAN